MTRHLLIRRAAALFFLCGFLLPAAPAAEQPWEVLEHARLVEREYFDGDSFHARAGQQDLVLRLYYVDAPETEKEFPERVQEQADYFGITVDQAVDLGLRAKEFTRRFLKDGFAIYTRHTDARGQSRQPRYYALIRVGDRWLQEALVENGLARVFGAPAVLPDGTNTKEFWAHLHELEKRAQQAKLGGWGIRAGALPQSGADADAEVRTVRLTRAVMTFDPAQPQHPAGLVRQGTTVEVLGAATGALVRIRFDAGGVKKEALARRGEIGP